MVHPANTYGIRTKERLHHKVLLTDNGFSLFKIGNTAVEPLFDSHWAWLPAPAGRVAVSQRRATVRSKPQCAANADSCAATLIVSWRDDHTCLR